MRSRHQYLLAFRYAAIYSRAPSFYLVFVLRVLLRGFLRRVRLNDLLPISDYRMFPSICALIFSGPRGAVLRPYDVPVSM